MSIVTATILSEGQELSATYDILSIETQREVNRVPTAELILLDGDPARRTFDLSDEDFFVPGKEIEIKLRWEGETQDETVFKGLVVTHRLEATDVESTLTVELKDKAVGMTKARTSAVFTQKSDSDIIKELIIAGGAEAGTLISTDVTYPETVQYACTNWDFMRARAEVNNLLVVVEDGKVSLMKSTDKGSATHSFSYGISEMYGFEMEADASHQYEKIESVAWDIKTQSLTQVSTAAPFALSQGDLTSGTLAGKFGGKDASLKTLVPLDPKEVQSWADGQMALSSLSLLRGVVSVPGFAPVKLMDTLSLSGIGKRFDGSNVITGIRHTVDSDGWQTDLQFGLSATPFSHSPQIQDTPAAGLMPGVNGLQVGIVDAFEDDQEAKEFRVRVILPGIDPETGKIWARLATPEAGLGKDEKGRGYFFRPEKGDEVVLGFFNDDPRQAVILGALFSSKNVPPSGWESLDAENALKGIVSKTGITMQINDTDQTLTLLTSENQSILMDEKNKQIVITDLNQNTITLDDQGVSLKVAGKLAVEADGDIELKGSNIKLEASGNVAISGSAVDIK